MENRRVKLTKLIIKTSFIELLQNKPLEQITVTELCAHADVNRSTFYDHYGDFGELMKEIEADFLNHMPFINFSQTQSKTLEGLISFMHYVQKSRESFIILIKNGMLADKIYERTMTLGIKSGRSTENNMAYAKLVTAYEVSGAVNVILRWLEEDLPCTAEEVANTINKLAASVDNCAKLNFKA